LLYKDDWADARDRMAAWWEGEPTDRPLIQVTAPKNDAPDHLRGFSAGYEHWGLAQFPDDPDRTIDSYEAWCSHTHFGGEAFPNFWVNFGAGVMGAYLGAEPTFRADTMWFGAQWDEKLAKGWDDLSGPRLDENEVWWKRTRRATERAVDRGRGKFIVGATDIGGIADVIASLRGPKSLLVDLQLRPNDVKSLSRKLVEIWHRCHDELLDIIDWRSNGSSAWMGIWSPLKWYPLQCDFAAMLSPNRFDEFVLPYLKDQCQRLDHAIYHLDGPGEICHLGSLLSISELRGIQWVPGSGEDLAGFHCGSEKWTPLYEKVLGSGRALVLSVPLESVEPVIRRLRSSRVLIQTTSPTRREADLLLERTADFV